MIKNWLKRVRQNLTTRPTRRRNRRGYRALSQMVDLLEPRVMLTATETPFIVTPSAQSYSTTAVNGDNLTFTPQTMRSAYGVNALSQTGSGVTIAIVAAYGDPYIVQDANTFSANYVYNSTSSTLPLFNQPGGPTLTVVNQTGGSTPPPIEIAADGAGWRQEESLDVEWAHVMAPNANIVLIETNTPFETDMMAGVAEAVQLPGVKVVSMSWGGLENASNTQYDQLFATPGITFVAAAGDTYQPNYPAVSPNVVSVGGSILSISGTGSSATWQSEMYWDGMGGGLSQVELSPAYQSLNHDNDDMYNSYTPNPGALKPDVSLDAAAQQTPTDYTRGVAIVDSYDGGSTTPWYIGIGGTSVGAPMMAGLMALADQGRTTALSSGSQTLPALYSAPSTDLHLVGYHPPYISHTGPQDTWFSGLGSPQANLMIPYLTSYSSSISLSAQSSVPSYTTLNSNLTVAPSITISATGNITNATIGVPNAQSGDSISFGTLPPGMTVTSATGSGIIWYRLSGSFSAATYQSILQSITFKTNSTALTTAANRRVDFSITDQYGNATGVVSYYIRFVNAMPTVTGLGGTGTVFQYAENQLAVPIGENVHLADSDSAYLSGATVVEDGGLTGDVLSFTKPIGSLITASFASHVLTLSGVDTVANYQAALQSVVYKNTVQPPSIGTIGMHFYVTDSSGDQSLDTIGQSYDYVTISNREATPPTVKVTNPSTYTSYVQNSAPVAVAPDFTILTTGSSDSSGDVFGAKVQITANFLPYRDLLLVSPPAGITSSYDYGLGVLTLTGEASVATYQSVLQSVSYYNTLDNPNNFDMGPVRPVLFQIYDGHAYSDSTAGTPIKYVYVTPVYGATPTVSVTGVGSIHSGGLVASSSTISDADALQMQSLVVVISAGAQANDALTVSGSLPSYVTTSFSNNTLTITGPMTRADYQTALNSIKMTYTTGGSRTLSFYVTDDTAFPKTSVNTASNSISLTLL